MRSALRPTDREFLCKQQIPKIRQDMVGSVGGAIATTTTCLFNVKHCLMSCSDLRTIPTFVILTIYCTYRCLDAIRARPCPPGPVGQHCIQIVLRCDRQVGCWQKQSCPTDFGSLTNDQARKRKRTKKNFITLQRRVCQRKINNSSPQVFLLFYILSVGDSCTRRSHTTNVEACAV